MCTATRDSVPAPRPSCGPRRRCRRRAVRAQAIPLQQMQHPAELRMRLVAELARLQPRHFEPGVLQQLVNLARRVFAIVPRVHLAGAFRRPDVGVKESRMIALQNARDAAQRRDVRRGQHQVAARPQNAVDLAHQVHRVFEQVLDQLAAEHRGEVRVGIRKRVLLGVEVIDLALESARLPPRSRCVVAAAPAPRNSSRALRRSRACLAARE